MELPLVSIVTPSLNAARFIEETIASVLSQDYPRIEYIVMDAGSDDGTADILHRHAGSLKYFIEKDSGTADAVNRGFRRATGSLFAWLSADDLYEPHAVSRAVACFEANPDAAVVCGQARWINEQGTEIGPYPTPASFAPALLENDCCFCQPACFIRAEAFRSSGMLNTSLHSAFDYDLWIRLAHHHRFAAVPEVLASSRMHRANKSLAARRLMFQESMALLRRHYGFVPPHWIYGYLSFLRDRRDQFFEPLKPSPLTWLAALPCGFFFNPAHPFRYFRRWTEATFRTLKR